MLSTSNSPGASGSTKSAFVSPSCHGPKLSYYAIGSADSTTGAGKRGDSLDLVLGSLLPRLTDPLDRHAGS